jgi:hypothetical protein
LRLVHTLECGVSKKILLTTGYSMISSKTLNTTIKLKRVYSKGERVVILYRLIMEIYLR